MAISIQFWGGRLIFVGSRAWDSRQGFGLSSCDGDGAEIFCLSASQRCVRQFQGLDYTVSCGSLIIITIIITTIVVITIIIVIIVVIVVIRSAFKYVDVGTLVDEGLRPSDGDS